MDARLRHIPAEHPLVKKEQGGERLIPRGCGDVALDRKVAEKSAHLRLAGAARWRLPLQKIKRLIQRTYAPSVRRL